MIFLGGKAFVNFGISTDCEDYITAVKQADLKPEDRDKIIKRLNVIREKARNGDHVGFARWVDHDAVIRKVYEDGEIDEKELETLRGELDSIEKALGIQ